MKKYLVTPTADEREQLNVLIAAGKAEAEKLAHGSSKSRAIGS